MPNVASIISPYVGNGNPDTYTEPPGYTYAGGDLGTVYDANDKTYTKVTVAAGATNVLANQLAFWSDRANYVVTNVSTAGNIGGVAGTFRNNVAGVFRSAVPAGYSCFILVRGRAVALREAGAGVPGMLLEANTGTAADALGVVVGTGLGFQSLGVQVSATSGAFCTANVDIQTVP